MNTYNSITSFATHSMTHAPAQRSAVIDFASVSMVATPITYGENNLIKSIDAILPQLQEYMTAVQARMKQCHPRPDECAWDRASLLEYAKAIKKIGHLKDPPPNYQLEWDTELVEMSMVWVEKEWGISSPGLLPRSSWPGGFDKSTKLGRTNFVTFAQMLDCEFTMMS